MKLARIAVLSALLLFASALPAAADKSAFVRAEPLTLMSGDAISACGARLMFDIDGTSLAIDLMLARGEDRAALVLRAGYESPSPSMLPVVKAVVRTSSISTGDLFIAPGRYEEDGTLILEAPSSDGRIANLFQELMVGGGSVEIAREFMLSPDTIVIPGPMPQSVRAGYLACAGDLVGRE